MLPKNPSGPGKPFLVEWMQRVTTHDLREPSDSEAMVDISELTDPQRIHLLRFCDGKFQTAAWCVWWPDRNRISKAELIADSRSEVLTVRRRIYKRGSSEDLWVPLSQWTLEYTPIPGKPGFYAVRERLDSYDASGNLLKGSPNKGEVRSGACVLEMIPKEDAPDAILPSIRPPAASHLATPMTSRREDHERTVDRQVA